MTTEAAFINALRQLAHDPAARSLADDAAVFEIAGTQLVLTHDMVVEGVHFLPDDPPADVAWKLVAVNLSDLAAKGAKPIGVLMGYSLTGDGGWDDAFIRGLEAALAHFGTPLLGGDTVSAPPGAPRTLGLTAVGEAAAGAPSRAGAKAGDLLWVSGTIGDAGAGLAIARGEREGPPSLLDRYRRPQPRLAAGQALAPLVSAMMDVSDGLLIDARRLADASGVGIALDLERVPLSDEYASMFGNGSDAVLNAAVAGDDYELLFTAPAAASDAILGLGASLGLPLTAVGRILSGTGLRLSYRGEQVALPGRLGYEHGDASANG